MTKRTRKNKFSAFSLIELMAAVVVVGILVSLALPRYRVFVARSRMAEAKSNLGIIATLQQSYVIEYSTSDSVPTFEMGGNSYCTDTDASMKNELGFRVVGNCTDLRYTYMGASLTTAESNANSNDTEIYPGCAVTNQDSWNIIGDTRKLTHHATNNAIKMCDN